MERMFYANGKPIGMKWYKFLIYFGLIVSPILNLVNAFNYITGNIYSSQTNGEVSAAIIYAYYGLGLKVLDVLYGVLMIGFAVLALVLRNKLANYKSDSLKYIKIFYSLLAVIPFSYSVVVAILTNTSVDVGAVGALIVNLVFLFLNINYFKKRAHLFIDKTVSIHIDESREQTCDL